jgi:tRNA1Val (adenine37-N6)-methyltransferase
MENLTQDSFFDGSIQVSQNRNGYRFSIDAVLLADYAGPFTTEKVLDLGTGCGIIPLILAYRYPGIRVYGIEIQAQLAALAKRNVMDNSIEERVSIQCLDMKDLSRQMTSGPVDLVVSNPPYHRANTGRINPDRQRAIARHEISISLTQVIETASRLLDLSGRFVSIYPAERLADILTHMRSFSIEPKFLRMVHSSEFTEAKLILVKGVKGGRAGLKVGAPLIIYRPDGSYTRQVARMFEP